MASIIYIANIRGYGDERFSTREAAEAWLREQGYEDTGEFAFETYEGFKGYVHFWTEDGRDLDSYGDGYEPRLYVGEEPDDED